MFKNYVIGAALLCGAFLWGWVDADAQSVITSFPSGELKLIPVLSCWWRPLRPAVVKTPYSLR